MVVLLRSRGCLRCLTAMALLAWLMLAVAPFGMWPRAVSAPQKSTMTSHASHGTMHMDEATCCADHANHPDTPTTQDCHCALPCAGLLPPTPASLAASPAMPARYEPPHPITAPLSGFAPPLRPPLA